MIAAAFTGGTHAAARNRGHAADARAAAVHRPGGLRFGAWVAGVSKPSSKGIPAKHPRGFVLVAPWHIAHCREPHRPLILGCIKVLGDANKSLRLAGDVPGTWLVDLNSAPVTVEDAE